MGHGFICPLGLRRGKLTPGLPLAQDSCQGAEVAQRNRYAATGLTTLHHFLLAAPSDRNGHSVVLSLQDLGLQDLRVYLLRHIDHYCASSVMDHHIQTG